MPQSEFAYQCGISNTVLSLLETGKQNVTIDTVQMIAAYMGVSVADLFTEKKIKYIVYPSIEEIEGKIFNTYGIAAMMDNVIVDYVNDISVDFDVISKLVDTCNTEELAIEHLHDVAEDTYMEQLL